MPFTLDLKMRLLVLLAASLVAFDAAAQDVFPSRPIEMVIPTAAGGGTDIALRQLGQLVEPILGQKIVVVNRPGAGGAIGMDSIIQAKPDGYVIGGLWNAPLTMTPHGQATMPKPGDYATVALVTWSPIVHCVKAAFPANNGKEYMEELRRNPNKYTYGNDGVGGTIQLATERVFAKLGVKARAVPFAGAGETVRAFLGDHIHIYGGSIAPVLPYVKDKSTKCLMVTSVDRNTVLPDTSSLSDLGAASEATVLWRGIIAPKALPADRIAVLQKAFATAALSPKFVAFMNARGEDAKGSSPAELRELIASEYQAMGSVLTSLGLVKR